MTIQEAKNMLAQNLTPLFGDREAKSVAKILLQHLTNLQGVSFLLEQNQVLNSAQCVYVEQAQQRLLSHEPIQYITGKAFFLDFELMVNPKVLIPRPETEELVRYIADDIAQTANNPTLQVLDIGTGSGCIALGLKYLQPTLQVWALDVSVEALRVAKQNAQNLGIDVIFFEADILQTQTLPTTQYDIIVSNPPYIPPNEKALMPVWVTTFEPHLALFSNNALTFYQAIAAFAQKHLLPNGFLYFELNEFYAQEIEAILQQNGFQNISLKKDYQQKWRIIKGQLKA